MLLLLLLRLSLRRPGHARANDGASAAMVLSGYDEPLRRGRLLRGIRILHKKRTAFRWLAKLTAGGTEGGGGGGAIFLVTEYQTS